MVETCFELEQRLRLLAATQFAHIGTVAALPALNQLPPAYPAAYIVPLAHEPQANDALQGVAHLQTFTCAVVVCVKHAGDATGAKALTQLVDCRQAVQQALVAWVPPGCDGVLAFTGGSLERVEAGTVWWTDEFAALRVFIAPEQS